jgi:hypothetical protein
MQPSAQVDAYESSVHRIFPQEMPDNSEPHTSELHVDPDHIWRWPIGQILGYPSGVIARASRRLYDAAVTASVTSLFFRNSAPTIAIRKGCGLDKENARRLTSPTIPRDADDSPCEEVPRGVGERGGSQVSGRNLEL